MAELKQLEIGFKVEMECTLRKHSEARVDGHIEALPRRKSVVLRMLGMYWGLNPGPWSCQVSTLSPSNMFTSGKDISALERKILEWVSS